MRKKKPHLSVGFFLAYRDIRRSNFWTTLLIVFVMSLTYFNMLLLGGILGGLAEGVTDTFRDFYSSDILVTPSGEKKKIERTSDVLFAIDNLEGVVEVSPRLTSVATVEYGYGTKLRESDISETTSAVLTGIIPEKADAVTDLSTMLLEGDFLSSGDAEYVVLGKDMVERYQSVQQIRSGFSLLKDVQVGSKVRITSGTHQKEFIVKGIVGTENGLIDQRILMDLPTLRTFLEDSSLDVNEIAIRLEDESLQVQTKEILEKTIDNDNVIVETADEAVPDATEEIKSTFAVLGDVIGGISLVVGAITIFIVIFVNAITRRKYIGILKGIGISVETIRISYVFQAMFYAISGVILGAIFIGGYLKPYFDIHPIVLPVAQGGLDISIETLLIDGVLLVITSMISGFVPSWIVTRQNTLDAILGR